MPPFARAEAEGARRRRRQESELRNAIAEREACAGNRVATGCLRISAKTKEQKREQAKWMVSEGLIHLDCPLSGVVVVAGFGVTEACGP